jgi:methyl-accepting chemotaxis protein
MKISDIKILYKILSCFLLLAIVVASATWFATSRMSMIDGNYTKIIDKDVAAALTVTRASRSFIAFRLANWQLIAETKEEAMKKAAEEALSAQKRFLSFLDETKSLMPSFEQQVNDVRGKFNAVVP